MPPIVKATKDSVVAKQFELLAEQWKSETELVSSTTAMVTHPAYQAIIALGPAVVPFLLRDLEREPIHWFEALQAITGADPVPCEHWSKIEAMRTDWLAWGLQRGLI
jgi:hypothetical protein